ncbi:MAG: hypothetical protein ACRC28_16425 [Clostridium sp.]|uniref:hypothetical protein n=1 Tax=Clostridium sp. TaxID=1506 RepID=UPI003F31BFC9
MVDKLGILIYLDEVLVKSINSIQGNFYGYIDIRTRKKAWDIGISARSHNQNQNTFYLEDRENKDKREGFKGYNKSDAKTETNINLCDITQEQHGGTRCEEEVKEIYTSYVYHMEFCNNLITNGRLKAYCNGEQCTSGDYIFLQGTLIENSILSYIEAILLIINAYGDVILDRFIPDEELLKTKNIKIILEKMKVDMENDGIMDLLVQNKKEEYILQVNTKYFFNNGCSKNINVGCVVNIVGKLVKKVTNDEQISLLRKLDQTDFYERLLEKISSIFNNINIGIQIPILQKVRIENTLQVIPISIFI